MELKVGDVLVRYYNGSIVDKIKIERVTKTQAIGVGYIFDKNQRDSDYIMHKGRDSWSMTSFAIETPELREEFDKQLKKKSLLNKVRDIKFNELPIEKLEKIIEIIETK